MTIDAKRKRRAALIKGGKPSRDIFMATQLTPHTRHRKTSPKPFINLLINCILVTAYLDQA
jgi:hypothetical protein